LRILIFGINYEPELAGIAPYTTGLAEHFAAQGHRVHVITGVPHYPEWLPGLATSDEAANPGVRRYRHFVPRRPTAPGRALYELTWMFSALRSIRNTQADVAIGVIPSLSGGVLAWLAGKRLRIPFGLLFQDTMGAAARQSGYAGAVRFAAVALRTEAFIGRRAAAVAVVADGFSGYLEGLGVETDRIQRVRNWTRWTPDKETREECRARMGWSKRDFICLHAGNMGRKQGLDNLLEAADRLRADPVRVVLAGGGNDRQRLAERVGELKLGNVTFLDVQGSGSYESILQAADVLIVNQRASVGDMALPSKLTSYFAAGRPVVAAVSPQSETAREVHSSEGGLVVAAEDPEELVKAIVRLRADPELAGRLGASGRRYAATYLDREAVMSQFDYFLSALMANEVVRRSAVAIGH
jgi:colanic acid biosynthesis glycosyl transferase WcaI